MARSVDKVQSLGFTLVRVLHLDGMALDSDATLALKIHVVKHLVDEFLVVERVSQFQKAVGQGRFAVVDMRDDAKISDVFHYGRKSTKNSLCALKFEKRSTPTLTRLKSGGQNSHYI